MTHPGSHPVAAVSPRAGGGVATGSRSLTATLFAVCLLAFLLPFGTVSCGEPVSFTGLELVTASVTGEDAELVREIEGQGIVLALAVVVAALLGLCLALAGLSGQGWSALAGLVALLLLPWVAALGLADFRIQAGFQLAGASLLAVVGVRARRLIGQRRAARRRIWPSIVGLVVFGLFVGVTAALCVSAASGLPA